jgi:hypothetical protein
MPGQMPILDSVRTPQHEPDQKARHLPSTAMVAISRCEELVPRYDFSIVYAGRPLSRYRIGPRRARSARYRCRRTLPCGVDLGARQFSPELQEDCCLLHRRILHCGSTYSVDLTVSKLDKEVAEFRRRHVSQIRGRVLAIRLRAPMR